MSQKITRAEVENEIESTTFQLIEGTTTILAVIKTKSGVVFTGTSACISPADFDKDTGETIARANAFNALWGALGMARKFAMAGCELVYGKVEFPG